MGDGMSPEQSDKLEGAYEENLIVMQRLLGRYLVQLEALGEAAIYEEATQEKWHCQFGEKETPLSVLQKLVAVQKTTQELSAKLRQEKEGKKAIEKLPHMRLREVDWKIIARALEEHAKKTLATHNFESEREKPHHMI